MFSVFCSNTPYLVVSELSIVDIRVSIIYGEIGYFWFCSILTRVIKVVRMTINVCLRTIGVIREDDPLVTHITHHIHIIEIILCAVGNVILSCTRSSKTYISHIFVRHTYAQIGVVARIHSIPTTIAWSGQQNASK